MARERCADVRSRGAAAGHGLRTRAHRARVALSAHGSHELRARSRWRALHDRCAAFCLTPRLPSKTSVRIGAAGGWSRVAQGGLIRLDEPPAAGKIPGHHGKASLALIPGFPET